MKNKILFIQIQNTKTLLLMSLVLFFLSNISTKAQDFQGKAFYQTKIKIDDAIKKRMDSSKMSDDRKAFFMKMMKKRMEKVYELSFNKTASIYKEDKKLETPSETSRFNRSANDILYKNTKNNNFTNKKESFGKVFLVKDSLSSYNWKLEKESKMIGKHLCFKATAKKEIKNEINRFRRFVRKEDTATDSSKIKTPKLTKITAWYTPQIPVNHGPKDYYGLPGLILEINAGNLQILCTKIVLNPKEKIAIKEPTKGKEISQKEYDKIVEKKIIEMRERYKNNRKKERPRSRHRRF